MMSLGIVQLIFWCAQCYCGCVPLALTPLKIKDPNKKKHKHGHGHGGVMMTDQYQVSHDNSYMGHGGATTGMPSQYPNQQVAHGMPVMGG